MAKFDPSKAQLRAAALLNIETRANSTYQSVAQALEAVMAPTDGGGRDAKKLSDAELVKVLRTYNPFPPERDDALNW